MFPAGRPLTIELTSDTVMNSLSIPALGGQIYAMAGMLTRLNLLADKQGTFMGRNTMYSGDGFSAQKFDAVSTDAAGFDAFLAEARASTETLDAATFEQLSQPTINEAGESLFHGRAEPVPHHHEYLFDHAGAASRGTRYRGRRCARRHGADSNCTGGRARGSHAMRRREVMFAGVAGLASAAAAASFEASAQDAPPAADSQSWPGRRLRPDAQRGAAPRVAQVDPRPACCGRPRPTAAS